MSRCALVAFFALTAVVAAHPRAAAGDAREAMRQELSRRFQPSQIEIQDPAREGMVKRQGRLLILAGDRAPAKPFRVVEAGRTHTVREHLMDFARIDIGEGGGVRAEPGPLTVPRGTRLVVLDVKLAGDSVRLLTHTAEPLGTQPDGDLVYGCTEFVFHFEPGMLASGAVEPIVGAIERWLEGALALRTCREGVKEICLEP